MNNTQRPQEANKGRLNAELRQLRTLLEEVDSGRSSIAPNSPRADEWRRRQRIVEHGLCLPV